MAIADITKPMALDETLQDTNTALGLLGKDTTLQAIVTALENIGINTVGNLASLVTTDKSSLVNAINEVAGEVDGLDTDKADKVTGATNGNLAGLNASGNLTDSTWSADKTTQSATGNPISISGLKSNQLAINPIITFEPIQAGSGTPSPSNIRAISGYDKIEVLSCQKNLFNKDDVTSIIKGYISSTIVAGDAMRTVFVKCKPSTTYTVSKTAGQRFTVAYTKELPAVGVTVYGATSNNTASSITITVGADAKYVVGYVFNGSNDSRTADQMIASVQIEENNQATTYVPYHKTTDLSESLGQTVYGLTNDVRSGLCTDIWTKIDMSTLSWGYNGTQKRYEADLPNAKSVGSGRSDKIVCSKYATDIDAAAGDSWKVFQSGRTVFVYDNDRTGNPTGDVAYILADVTIQLTPHEIALSQGYNYISTNGTSISLAYHNGELASLADVEQLAETVNALPNFFLPDYANALSVHSGALEINSSYSEYTAPQNGYIIIAEMYGAVDTSSTPFSPPYFDIRIDQKRIFSTQAFIATNERASGTIIPIAKGSLFQYRVTNKKLNELIIWFAPIKYV